MANQEMNPRCGGRVRGGAGGVDYSGDYRTAAGGSDSAANAERNISNFE